MAVVLWWFESSKEVKVFLEMKTQNMFFLFLKTLGIPISILNP